MNIISRLGLTLWFSLLLTIGCSADVPQAPTNQTIKGPFIITAEWQEIRLKKPLKSLSHIQELQFLFKIDEYNWVDDINVSEFFISTHGFQRISDSIVLKPEVILLDKTGKQFMTVAKSSGKRESDIGYYYTLSFGINPNKGKFFYPKDLEVVAIKVRANEEIQAEHLSWYAPYYYQAPNNTWDNVQQSEIVTFQ